MPQIYESRLEEKLIALESVRAWSPRVISKLETLIRSAEDYALFRINSVKYAKEKGISETEALDLFLHATKLGLFEMEWDLLCPSCGHIVESFSELTHLHADFNCPSCYVVMTVAFDDYIQVAFTISPQVRPIAYHQPMSLTIDDYYFRYHLVPDLLPAPLIDAFRSYTLHLAYLAPQASLQLDLTVHAGIFNIRELTRNPQAVFFVQPIEATETQVVKVRLEEKRCVILDRPAMPFDFQSGAFTRHVPNMGQLQQGKIHLEIENQSPHIAPLWVMNFGAESGQTAIIYENFVSGKHLLTNQTFRTLFRSETVQTEEGIGIHDITLIFTDLKGSTAMYDAIGDPKAYYLVRQHFDTLTRVIQQHRGAVVKTIGDAVMASFMSPLDAVQAGLAMLTEMDKFNQTISEKLHLKIGIHRGHSIVVTLNDRLDYFGQTVNIAARVQGIADSDEIYITESVYEYEGMASVLAPCAVQSQHVEVKGVSSKLLVYQVKQEQK